MGCRKYKGEAFFDDLSQETHLPEELEEIVFVIDGRALVIDLDDDNAQAFRAALAPYVAAARETSKAKVLATLPKKRRHLQAVPDTPPSPAGEDGDSVPEVSGQNAPFPQEGQSVETRTDAEGTRVPEPPPNVSDFVSGSQIEEAASRPALAVVKPPTPEKIPDEWAPYAPSQRDDQQSRVFKARKWTTLMGSPANQVLTAKVFTEWEGFYHEQRWRDIN